MHTGVLVMPWVWHWSMTTPKPKETLSMWLWVWFVFMFWCLKQLNIKVFCRGNSWGLSRFSQRWTCTWEISNTHLMTGINQIFKPLLHYCKCNQVSASFCFWEGNLDFYSSFSHDKLFRKFVERWYIWFFFGLYYWQIMANLWDSRDSWQLSVAQMMHKNSDVRGFHQIVLCGGSRARGLWGGLWMLGYPC